MISLTGVAGGGIWPGGMIRAAGAVRVQAVSVPARFGYQPQPVLDHVGPVARVSFERDGETLGLVSARLIQGAVLLCRNGNVVTLHGIRCGVPVGVCVRTGNDPDTRIRFVFR
ncbi:MAG: hypothetical protein KDI44_02620 [Thiothrix sp.]|nr:hypothetical protein [Thiothrix sp.]HPQ94189.1 hypothetical protein [Thiolinea sp.]